MDRDTTRQTAVEQFEKNRFFEGKLMTARDMEVEQRYHARRLRTLARYTTGTGIVRGLTVEGVEAVDSELEVTVEPGLAIDGLGRPLVVDSRTTKTVPEPAGETVFLSLRRAEVAGESVPVPGDEPRTNRAIEGVEVTYRESPPGNEAGLPDLPLAGEVEADTGALAERLGDGGEASDPAVFVGAYERTAGGWNPMESGPSRSRVYSNDALFELLSAHLADDANPHQVEPDEAPGPPAGTLDDSEAILQQLDSLRETVATLQARQEPLVRYVRRRSLAGTVRQFGDVADRFEGHDNDVTRRAKAVVTAAEAVLDGEHGDSSDERLTALVDAQVALGEALSGAATQSTREHYAEAVSTMQQTLDGDPTALDAAVSQDRVTAAADRLSVLYDVVPE